MLKRLIALVSILMILSKLLAQDDLINEVDSAYASSLYELAERYAALGNYPDAIRLGTDAMEIRKKVYGPEHPEYANSLYCLANYNAHLGNYIQAISLGTEAKDIYNKFHETE